MTSMTNNEVIDELIIRDVMNDIKNASKLNNVDPLYGACKVIVRFRNDNENLQKQIYLLKQSTKSQFGNNNFGVFK